MNRNNKLVLLPHCFFNQNSVVNGEARTQREFFELLNNYFDENTSYYQMECPEFNVYGMKRIGMSKDQLHSKEYVDFCINYAMKLVDIYNEYKDNGTIIDTIVGVKGSPSCGITKTCQKIGSNFEMVDGKGLFIDTIESILKENQIELKFIELD